MEKNEDYYAGRKSVAIHILEEYENLESYTLVEVVKLCKQIMGEEYIEHDDDFCTDHALEIDEVNVLFTLQNSPIHVRGEVSEKMSQIIKKLRHDGHIIREEKCDNQTIYTLEVQFTLPI